MHTLSLKNELRAFGFFNILQPVFIILVLLFVLNISSRAQNAASQDELVVEFYSIPSPDEILSYIHQNQIDYTPRLLVNTQKRNQYSTFKERLLSYGFYTANMAYAMSFEQTNTALEYFDITDNLGKNLNIFPPETEKLTRRLMRNMNNIDSLNMLYDEIYLTVIANLHDTERFGEYALISAGGFVESLYLALNSSGRRGLEDDFRMRIWDQKMILDQIVKMFELYLSPQLKNEMLNDIKGLRAAFNEYTQIAAQATGQKRADGAMVIGAANNAKQGINPIENIHAAVNELRAKWVK